MTTRSTSVNSLCQWRVDTFSTAQKGFTKTLRCLLTMAVCLLMQQAMATVRYVNGSVSNNNGNGLSWGTAYKFLETAINASSSGDEIWIRTGTYRPQGNGSNAVSTQSCYFMKSGVKVYGGFAGTENTLGGRNPTANPVNLKPTTNPIGLPVMYYTNVNNTSLLDGVTISDGNATNYTNIYSGYTNSGGAMAITNASPTISNVIFSNNTAGSFGGAVFTYLSDPVFTNVSFINNKCSSGGAVAILGNSPTFTNVTFTDNYSFSSGGAIYLQGSADFTTLTNIVFTNNKAGYTGTTYNTGSGGGLYSTNANYILNRSVFNNNRAGGNGGGIFNDNDGVDRLPVIKNTVFNSNGTYTGFGGGIGNERSSPTIVNCSFLDNYCGVTGGGGGVYTYSTVATQDQPTAIITNCVFSQNGYSSGGSISTLSDVAKNTRGNNSVSYSYFRETGTFIGAKNITAVGDFIPFVNRNSAIGADGIWMTADDGLQLSFCSPVLIDKGDNTAMDETADITGLPRKRDVNLVVDSGNGTAPIVDMGAYENQNNTTLLSLVGSIGTAHTIPNPQEQTSDLITSTQNPALGTNISWQQMDGSSTEWFTATNSTNSPTYSIPSIGQTTKYRRVVTSSVYCNTPFYSNEVTITVVQPNGVIEGQVTTNNNVPVQGITITVTRLTAVAGGPANYTYPPIVTGGDGKYTINNVYFGTQATGATFRITPSKPNHSFNFPYLDRTLTPNTPHPTGVDFKDTSAISITGSTYQQCTDCIIGSGIPITTGTQTCPIDSVNIYKGGFYATATGFIDSAYGRFAITVTDPSALTLEARLTGHTFSPASRSITPTDNVSGIDFKDVTMHTISGKISAGCNDYIGDAVLEFTDILPNGAGNTVRPSCFRKQVSTNNGSGYYSITLPARKYTVRVVSFLPAYGSNNLRYVSEDSVKNFINSKVPKDSLSRDISTHDTTLNLVYQRPPSISIAGGLGIVCNNFALLGQSAIDSFNVFAYQGPATLGCLVSDTNKLHIITNVHQEDQTEEFLYPLADTGTKVKLKGGTPKTFGDYLKTLSVYFMDKYGRGTVFNRNVLVTGVKSDGSTFFTVSPEVPLVVLHDPPGDASFSTWQQNQSITNAMRFYTAASVGAEAWVEAKLGAKFMVGIGVATEVDAWGTLKGTIGVSSTVTPSNESIVTTTTSNNFSTADYNTNTGSLGDVYIGAALNLAYAVGTEISYSNCAVTSKKKLVIANNGFATQYIYSEDHIINTLIPQLQSIAQQVAQTFPDSAARYLNQVKVWQQVVDNNTENKRRAAFVQNYSFSGGIGPYTNTTTTSSTKTNTLEFAVDVNATVATELGFEVAGSGASGGASVNFKLETGGSESNTVTNETTIAYTLQDNDPGDFFSVNVKKDPVYNTPVFELAAGTASCPAEQGAQARDDIYVTALNPIVQNVAANDYANFSLRIVNTSPSHEPRTYRIAYDQGTNVANETIRIAGSDYPGIPVTLNQLNYLDSVTVVVSIKRLTNSSIYSYEGERFRVLDNCDGSVSKTVQVSAYYVAPCSSISLAQPTDGWTLTSNGSNQIFIKPAGFDLSTLTSVELQYAGANGSWNQLASISNAQLTSGFNLDASMLPEGTVNLRLRLDCSSGTVYSPRSSGFIDRKAPLLFGNPDPTDDNYVNGDIIAFTYNEKLNTSPANLQVTIRRLSNGQLIPATASIYENKIVITPTNSINSFYGDSIRVIVSGLSDAYGNVKTKADTTRFTVGNTVISNSNQAMTVSVTNPTVYKNGDSTINIFFNLPANAANETRVNYTIGGTARFGIDYTVTYSNPSASYANFNGSTGSIKIANGTSQAVLKIKPISDTGLTANKTVIISLAEGGDYSLGSTTTAYGSITSEDNISVYTFIGDGDFNIKSNWLDGKMPLSTLAAGKEIIINPSGTCYLNVPLTLRPTAKLTVKENRKFIILGSIKIQ